MNNYRSILSRLSPLPKAWGTAATHDATKANREAWEERKRDGFWMQQVVNAPRDITSMPTATRSVDDPKVQPIKTQRRRKAVRR